MGQSFAVRHILSLCASASGGRRCAEAGTCGRFLLFFLYRKTLTLMALKYIPIRLGTGALALSALVLAGCASMSPAPEAAVEQRATAYWKARQTGQVEKTYALTPPSYRKVRTFEQFRLQFGAAAAVKSVEVTKVTCEPEKCVARIKLSVTPALVGLKLGNIETYLDETWLLEDGQWWHYQDL
jgi:hypothetical protein